MTEEPSVTLRRKDSSEFSAWRDASVAAYAEDLARSSERPLPEAVVAATESFNRLLPLGAESPGTSIWTVVTDDGTDVGTLWVGPHPDLVGRGYVYEIEIYPPHQRKGYARAAMRAAEDIARAAGWTELGLNVFGFNEGALRLYEGLGYRVVATQMTKSL